mgnify:CR=1 FL=1
MCTKPTNGKNNTLTHGRRTTVLTQQWKRFDFFLNPKNKSPQYLSGPHASRDCCHSFCVKIKCYSCRSLFILLIFFFKTLIFFTTLICPFQTDYFSKHIFFKYPQNFFLWYLILESSEIVTIAGRIITLGCS